MKYARNWVVWYMLNIIGNLKKINLNGIQSHGVCKQKMHPRAWLVTVKYFPDTFGPPVTYRRSWRSDGRPPVCAILITCCRAVTFIQDLKHNWQTSCNHPIFLPQNLLTCTYLDVLVQERPNSIVTHWSNVFLALTHPSVIATNSYQWTAEVRPSGTTWR